MSRRRSMHALLGTLALIAGCSTTHRTEVTGVVRDRATGRVIAGARVVGADGALAQTDAHGRFTLYVRHGSSADVRVSAEGHASEHVELAGLDANVELAPTLLEGDSFVIQPDEVSVLSWNEETWLAIDGGVADGSFESELGPSSHVSTWMGDAHDGALGAGAACIGCHGAAMLAGDPVVAFSGDALTSVEPFEGAHVGLADACVACHAPRLGPDARASCARCHGATAAASADALARELASASRRFGATLDQALAEAARIRHVQTSCGGLAASFTQVGGAFVLVDARGVVLGDCDEDGALDASERFERLDQLGEDLASRGRMLAWIEADGSHGAHSPELARSVLRSLAD